MTTPKRRMDAADLLHGDDHEFIVNMYLAALRRWPDEPGYRHFMRLVANRPERRVEALREMGGSEEARRNGGLVDVAENPLPGDPNRARDAMVDVRTEVLHTEISQLRQALELLSGVGGQELAGLREELTDAREAELRSEINALRREMQAALATPPAPPPIAGLESRLAALEQAAGEGQRASADLVSRLVCDYVGDMLQLLEARFEQRLRGIEARLLSLRLP